MPSLVAASMGETTPAPIHSAPQLAPRMEEKRGPRSREKKKRKTPSTCESPVSHLVCQKHFSSACRLCSPRKPGIYCLVLLCAATCRRRKVCGPKRASAAQVGLGWRLPSYCPQTALPIVVDSGAPPPNSAGRGAAYCGLLWV